MWLGRFFQGGYAPLFVQCRTSDGAVVAPAAAPTVTIFDADFDTARSAVRMPPADPGSLTGLFVLPFFLDALMPVGRYVAIYQWNDGSDNRSSVQHFEVIGGWANAGGGGLIGIEFYDRPNGRFLVCVDERHEISFRKNPKVTT